MTSNLSSKVKDLWGKILFNNTIKYTIPGVLIGTEISEYGTTKNLEGLVWTGLTVTILSFYGVLKDIEINKKNSVYDKYRSKEQKSLEF